MNAPTATARHLAALTPGELRDALRADPRLLLPVGALAVRWPHLPVGTDTIIVDHLADDLSARCGVLRAPTVSYGATAPAPATALGATAVRKKTLHRLLNDLLGEWEAHGVDEFVLLTVYRHDPHLEALATVITARARVRVVDALAVRCDDVLDAPEGDARGEELATSVLLHLAPGLVRDVRNIAPDAPPGAPTADKGARVYGRILDRIADRVLGIPESGASSPGGR
ncbi:hypothetical protein tb265_00980 [Gemmatimonadetes bacterium T265]|nr:hypothetical protein tb265_00980 [Gemmatimonadetes bacterium T265]